MELQGQYASGIPAIVGEACDIREANRRQLARLLRESSLTVDPSLIAQLQSDTVTDICPDASVDSSGALREANRRQLARLFRESSLTVDPSLIMRLQNDAETNMCPGATGNSFGALVAQTDELCSDDDLSPVTATLSEESRSSWLNSRKSKEKQPSIWKAAWNVSPKRNSFMVRWAERREEAFEGVLFHHVDSAARPYGRCTAAGETDKHQPKRSSSLSSLCSPKLKGVSGSFHVPRGVSALMRPQTRCVSKGLC
eukprot:TRINITY_DN37574_c0_g1_i1.p1 TRINITY_DN37574_c0_g1~~TRINITY_DN37574_c0_g1_i1.p1  ORF type:complete len:255 (-),score=27.36 TRINITY_DN37574_c0_g1_i1:667-1431(-)